MSDFGLGNGMRMAQTNDLSKVDNLAGMEISLSLSANYKYEGGFPTYEIK